MGEVIDHVVIGGGLAGSMIALKLIAAGRNVVLLEKQTEAHHKVCGEFLSIEAVQYLQNVGTDPLTLGAHPIQRVRLHSGSATVEAPLPFAALSLSRLVLDQILLENAEAAGCTVRRGVFVDKLLSRSEGTEIYVRAGEPLLAQTVFLATGKHDLSTHPRTSGTQRDLVGFKMHWRLAPESLNLVQNTMELFLFRDGYGGLAPIEGGTANLCFVLRQKRMRQLGGWQQLLSAIRNEVPAIDRILNRATQCWPKPLAISPIPYGHLARASNGFWPVGDQAAVIPSFTGDGMSIALHSAELAAEMYLAGKTPDEYLACLRDQLSPGMRVASALSRIMVTPAGRMLAPMAVSLLPGAIGLIAERTRIPERALRSKQLNDRLPSRHAPAPVA